MQRAFAARTVPIQLSQGHFFYHDGEKCGQVAMVGRGRIRVFKTADTGREITLYTVEAGDLCIFNISCIMAGIVYPASARVEKAGEALVVPASQFREWVHDSDVLQKYVFVMIAKRLAEVMTLVEEVVFRKLDSRLATFLLDAFAQSQRARPALHLTHDQIAGELGSAREVISRLLKEFERSGAVSLSRGTITLKDQDVLRQFHAAP